MSYILHIDILIIDQRLGKKKTKYALYFGMDVVYPLLTKNLLVVVKVKVL